MELIGDVNRKNSLIPSAAPPMAPGQGYQQAFQGRLHVSFCYPRDRIPNQTLSGTAFPGANPQANLLERWHLKSRLPVSECKTPSSHLRLWECPYISPTRCRVNSAPCHHHHRHLWASLKEALLVAVLPHFLHLLLVGCLDTHLRCRWVFHRWGWDLMGCSRV